MIALAQTLLPASLTASLARVGSVVGLAFGGVATRWRHRREIRNLAEFDDRMLSDIGLTRSDVSSALAEPLHLNPSWVLVRCVDQRTRTEKRGDPARKARPAVPLVKRAA